MNSIDWEEFKIFKTYSSKKGDNFEVLLDFLKSFYSITSSKELFEIMLDDDTAQLMLRKREFHCVEDLEKHLFKNFNEQ